LKQQSQKSLKINEKMLDYRQASAPNVAVSPEKRETLLWKTYTNIPSGIKYVIGITTNTSPGNNINNKQPNGPSLNVNVTNSDIIKYGGPYKMSVKIPNDLTFKPTSSPGHFVLVPINDMLESTFLNKLTILQNGLQNAQ
jgi:hypothetical protein